MLTANKNGFSSFVVPHRSLPMKEDIQFRCNRDSGNTYLASSDNNRLYLDKIIAGNTLTVVVVTEGIKSITYIYPHEADSICYQGQYLNGKALVSQDAERGDMIKLASMDGKMWHVIESVGTWIKEGLDGNRITW